MGDAAHSLEILEGALGGPVATARLLGVNYTGSYCAWKSGRRPLPYYIQQSIKAHLKLLELGLL